MIDLESVTKHAWKTAAAFEKRMLSATTNLPTIFLFKAPSCTFNFHSNAFQGENHRMAANAPATYSNSLTLASPPKTLTRQP